MKKRFSGLGSPHRLLLIISIVIVLIAQTAQAQAPAGCGVVLSIQNAAINPGADNQFRVQLNPAASCQQKPVKIEVVDPKGFRHEFNGITDVNARIPWTSYLKRFDNVPDTHASGRYYVIATSYTGHWAKLDFVVNVICDEIALDSGLNLIAERQITLKGIPEVVESDIVACTNLNCYYDLVLDKNCAKTGGSFPVAALNVGVVEPSSIDYTVICHRVLPGTTDTEYTSIMGSDYMVIGKDIENTNSFHYWIVDIRDDECIVGDVSRCGLITEKSGLTEKRLVIDEVGYRAHVVNDLAFVDRVCRGFYTPEMGWLYDIFTPRYLAAYGDLTDFLYCSAAPDLISESQWCHLINLGWYSVVDRSEEGTSSITSLGVQAENDWNNLSGYIVLGHACPIGRDDEFFAAPAAVMTFDATEALPDDDSIDVPCNDPFAVPCGKVLPDPQCIYVWTSSDPANGVIGYKKRFDYAGLNPSAVDVMVADSVTDTQIPAFDLIKDPVESMESRIRVNGFDSGCNPVPVGVQIFNYGPPYRECVNEQDLSYYRLFDQDTVWTKIFAVTPMLEDEHWAWDWDWSNTSAPGRDTEIRIYIGGGCKRTTAFYFDYPNAFSQYVEPIVDEVEVTIDHGVGAPTVYNVPGRNLLPFPPADSIVDDLGVMIYGPHPYEGIRYSFFRIDHIVPEDAIYLNITANYSCYTKLERDATAAGCAIDTVEDTSYVVDNFLIEFLEHENTRENCKWTSPLRWTNISGTWERIWDGDLGKNVFHLDVDNTQGRRMVSLEEIPDEKVIEVLVRGDALGDYADSTVGFYSDEDASNFWFVDIAADSLGNKLAIGNYEDARVPKSSILKTEPTPIVAASPDRWYWIKVLIDNGKIYAKSWLCTDPVDPWACSLDEPENWMITYEMTGVEAPYGNYWVIGTEGGSNDEEFWFDPEPMCGLDVRGYYTPHLIAPLGYSVVTDGFVEIRIKPDILSGVNVSVGDSSFVYEHATHPAKHILYRKEKAAPSPPNLDMHEFYFEDKYGYESTAFNFNELCKLPVCPPNCYCLPDDIFSPECANVEPGWSWKTYPDDCICVADECYPDPCASTRTYHEFEGFYYDFVNFYTLKLSKEEEYLRTAMDKDLPSTELSSWIDGRDMSAELDISKINSAEGRYRIYFSCTNTRLADFQNLGRITVFTHLRSYTFNLRDVLRQRGKASIAYVIDPPREFIKPGDFVTVNLTLSCGVVFLEGEDVEVIIPNYEDKLVGVRWEKAKTEVVGIDWSIGPAFVPFIKPIFRTTGDRAYVTTDSMGSASFGLSMEQSAAHVTLYYEGGDECSAAEANFVLGGEDVSSIITGVDFILLLLIFILAIFSYRWFKKGRLDFYEMWQEFRGEKD